MHEKHPIVTVIFLGLITSCACLILPQVWSSSSSLQQLLVVILLPQPYIFTYLAASTRMNQELYVTPRNLQQQLSYYPYDYCLYHPGIECRTCHLAKPARSKHCSICKACVARADHHCIWVNNCLGRGNYKWFIYLLISTSALLFLGANLAYSYLNPRVAPWLLRASSGSRRTAGDPTWVWFIQPVVTKVTQALDWLQIALRIGGLHVTGVGMLAAFTAPLPLGLLSYHIYLIWAGTTTNESGKWSDWRDNMLDGIAWIGDLKPDDTCSQSNNGVNGHADDPYATLEKCDWPTRSRFCMVTTTDGQAPRPPLPHDIAGIVDLSSWRRVWRLAQVENIYDLGFWDNLSEVLT